MLLCLDGNSCLQLSNDLASWTFMHNDVSGGFRGEKNSFRPKCILHQSVTVPQLPQGLVSGANIRSLWKNGNRDRCCFHNLNFKGACFSNLWKCGDFGLSYFKFIKPASNLMKSPLIIKKNCLSFSVVLCFHVSEEMNVLAQGRECN